MFIAGLKFHLFELTSVRLLQARNRKLSFLLRGCNFNRSQNRATCFGDEERRKFKITYLPVQMIFHEDKLFLMWLLMSLNLTNLLA